MRERTDDPASGPRTSSPLTVALRLVGLLALGLALSACALLPVEGATAKGRMVDGLYAKIAILALIVLIGVVGTLVTELVMFRKRDDLPAPQDHGKPWVVASFFGVGLVLVAVLFPSGEATLSSVDKIDSHPAANITLTGSQWQWSAAYQDDGFTVSGQTYRKPLTFELPVNKSVRIELRSTDVMHEFYVPAFLFMRNAVPGNPTAFSFTPDRLGSFPGQCAQLCGTGHYQMTFTVKVVTAAEYHRWVLKEKSEAQAVHCAAASGQITLTAKNVAWSSKCIGAPADKPFTVTMHNEDGGVQHNFAIYDTPKMTKTFFKGPIFTGVATKVLHVPALPAGTYYFQCDVHGSSMSGTLIVGARHSEQQQATGDRIKVVAKNVSWNVDQITVPAGKPVTVTMENEDAGTQHNFAVYDGPELTKTLFKGPIFAGVATRLLHVPALPAGTYYFQCDIHGVSMSGQYVVEGPP